MSEDLIATKISWLDRVITHPDNATLFVGEDQLAIQRELSTRWEKENRLELLNDLAGTYREEHLLAVIDIIISANSRRDWEQEAKENENSLEAFIKLLWVQLAKVGFEFSYKQEGNVTKFCVTRCPMYEVARQIGAEKWMYHLVCLTDEPSITGFNKDIRFSRTRTLMQGFPDCDHTYTDFSK
jgi:predicted ArsR family transcriptional regulator